MSAPQASRSQTGTIFKRYSKLEAAFARWAETQALSVPGADPAQVADRLTQRLVGLTADHFTNDILEYGGVDAVSESEDLRGRVLNGVSFNEGMNQVRLEPRLIYSGLIDFFAMWGRALLAILHGLISTPTKQARRATFFMDMPVDHPAKIHAFADFCRNGPIEPLRTAGTMLVQAGFAGDAGKGIVFSPWPPGHYLSKMASRRLLLKLLWCHVGAPLPFLLRSLRNPAHILLAQDAALLAVMVELDRNRLIESIVISLSRFKSQMLWFKGLADQSFPLHMVWYSQNCVPKVYGDENVESDLPALKHIRADAHWVWTEGFADYLRGVGQTCRIEVVGPILYYRPGPVDGLPAGRKVVLFDIIPVAAENGVFGVAENYYSVGAIQKFVRDAVVATRELSEERGERIWCLLKHKRMARAAHHSAGYPAFLAALQDEFDHFRLIDTNINLYGLLGECDTSVAVPYTTTCAVAASLHRPSAYYDPYATLVPRYERLYGVEFVSTFQALKNFIGSAISATARVDRNTP